MRETPLPETKALMTSLRVLSFCLACGLLTGCKPDVEQLARLVPAGVTITEEVSAKAKAVNCERATFIAKAEPDALKDWTRLGRLFDAKLSECIDVEEQVRWKQAIARGTAWWLIVQRPRRAHLWYDTETGRLQVLTLAQDD